MHYAIDSKGNVFSYRSKSAAQGKANEIGGHYASDDAETGLKDVPTPMLVTLHNLIRPEKPVTRFADRKTAETRMKGVLEVLSKPGEAPAVIGAIESAPAIVADGEETNDTAPGAEETNEMATKTKGARKGAAKKGAAKKTTAKTTARVPRANVTDATVRKVIKARADGKGWPEILKDLGEKPSFVHVIRPLMKAMDKSSVKKMGPGSPNYGKGK